MATRKNNDLHARRECAISTHSHLLRDDAEQSEPHIPVHTRNDLGRPAPDEQPLLGPYEGPNRRNAGLDQ